MSFISTDLQLITPNSSAEATSNWVNIATTTPVALSVDNDAKVQGIGCLKNNNLATVIPNDCGQALNTNTYVDCTNKLIFFWRNHTIPTNLPNKGQGGGSAVYVSNSSTHFTTTAVVGVWPYKVFDLGGADSDQIGGWNSYAIDPSKTSLITTGTFNVQRVQSLGFTRKYLTGVASPSDFVDVVRYGTGLKMRDSSGVTGSESSFDELFATDNSTSTAFGVLTKNNGIYSAIGKIIIGGWNVGFTSTNFAQTYYTSTSTNADSQTSLTYFKDNDETIVFKTLPVSTSTYEIRVATTGTLHTVFQLGNYDYTTGLASGDITIRGNVDNGAMSSQQESSGTLFAQTIVGPIAGANITKIGQSFRCTQDGSKLKNVSFWINRVLAPNGTLYARLYNMAGTYGVNSTATTGAALSTSSGISAATVSATAGWQRFTFTGVNQYAMTEGNYYVIALELDGSTTAAGNHIAAYVNNTVSVHPGNHSTSTGGVTGWRSTATTDLVHKLYTFNPAASWRLNAANIIPGTGVTTGTNIIKLYSSYFANVYSTVLNGNTRSITTGMSIVQFANTMTTSTSITANNIVPNMQISGPGLTTSTWISTIDDDNNMTLTSTSSQTVTGLFTFTDRSEIISCTFNSFGNITPNGCYITDTLFQNLTTTPPISATYAMTINTTTDINNVINNCRFVNAGRAIQFTAPGTYYLDNILFSGNTFDLVNTSAGLVTVNAINGSNPSVAKTTSTQGGASLVLNLQRTFTVSNVITSSTVRLVTVSGYTVLAQATNIGGVGQAITGNATVVADTINIGRWKLVYTYGYQTDIPIYAIVIATGYQALRPSYTLQNGDAVYQAGQVLDRQYTNPA